tara:strand:- start:2070 stop:4382 length:2313 start_codon:yes stop_codon:yes gene_type:complete
VDLKKPGELFDGRIPEKPTINVGNSHIREEFNKVEELRKQLNDVSSSLDNSLTEVVDKNLNFLTDEYSNLLEKVNNKINIFKEEINDKVIDIKKSNHNLKAEIAIVEQRQNRINISTIKEEVIADVQNLLSGDVANNIQKLEEKIEVVRESYQQTLNEGLLDEPPSTKNSDPLTPTDQKFATIEDLNKHYNLFLNRIQQQLTTLGGGGAVNIRDLDDVDLSTAQVNNKFLKYDSATSKWVGADASGGGYTLPVGSGTTLGGVKVGTGLTITATGILSTTSGGGSGISTQFVAAETLTVTGVTTHYQDVQFPGAAYNILWDQATSKIKFDDSAQCVFGSASGGDMKLFHASGNSTIRNETGQFRIAGNDIRLQSQNHSEDYIICTDGGDVKLFFNDNQKFATTNHGVVITGIATATSFVGDGSGLTGITGSGSGVVVKDSGTLVGTAGTIDFATNLSVTPIHLGIVTVTSSGGGGSLALNDLSNVDATTGVSNGKILKYNGSSWETADDDKLSTEEVQDIVGAMFSGNTETNIAATYQDSDGTIDLVADNDNTQLSTEQVQDIVGAMFTGNTETNIAATYQDSDGTIDLVADNDNTQLSTEAVQDIVGAMFSGNTETNITATYQDSDGTVDLVATAGGALDTRGDTSTATGSIAQSASADITIATRGKSFSLLKVSISAPAWVVLYIDTASRSSDSSRTEGTDPAPGSGVLTEVSTTTAGASTFLMSPAVLGWNNDTPSPSAQIYAKVTNKRATSGSNAITVTLTTVKLEA